MTNDPDIEPAADASPTSASGGPYPERRRDAPQFVGIRGKAAEFVGKRSETSRNVAIRRGAVPISNAEASILNNLPTKPDGEAGLARSRRKYGDWQRAAELFAQGRTPSEVAGALGVPLPKVIRNLRESRRLRRWIAEHYLGLRGTEAALLPASRSIVALRPDLRT